MPRGRYSSFKVFKVYVGYPQCKISACVLLQLDKLYLTITKNEKQNHAEILDCGCPTHTAGERFNLTRICPTFFTDNTNIFIVSTLRSDYM